MSCAWCVLTQVSQGRGFCDDEDASCASTLLTIDAFQWLVQCLRLDGAGCVSLPWQLQHQVYFFGCDGSYDDLKDVQLP
jgi:hypothetical protein